MTPTFLHTSDEPQRTAAAAIQAAVDAQRNKLDQQRFWQDVAHKSMDTKRFGRNYGDDEQEAYR